jgi:hypothetical protein
VSPLFFTETPEQSLALVGATVASVQPEADEMFGL